MKQNFLLVPADCIESESAFLKALSSLDQIENASVFRPFENNLLEALEALSRGEAAAFIEQIALQYLRQFSCAETLLVVGAYLPKNSCAARKLNEMLSLALDATTVIVASEKDSLSASCLASELKEARVRVGGISLPECVNEVILPRIQSPALDQKISQAAFRAGLILRASEQKMRILLPEGAEPRTVEAAILAYRRGIAHPILLGDKAEILSVAKNKGLEIPEGLEVLEIKEDDQKRFVPTLVELRRAKGMTEELAAELLKDPVWLGTMMLKAGEVDGLVSGAVHSTADTIRPALQVIKTLPGVKSISSVFFMCLPSETILYGDCAVNPNPDAETLATIAIQCHDTAKAFGLPARVAMLSYSTGKSGKGDDVDLVREALSKAKDLRPDMEIDGPLQYDAASTQSVANEKMPGSFVAGRATVYVFPDLNSGNIGYKAVQRSAGNVISIGPMLQGLAKPVNDLSRGALVEDIVYTIALTAIQAQELLKSTLAH